MTKASIESFALNILKSNVEVIGCHIIANPGGGVMADIVKSEFRNNITRLSQSGSGMAPLWGIAAVNLLRRMDNERSKLKYVTVVREAYETLIFPVPTRDNLIIGIEMTRDTSASKIYGTVSKLAVQFCNSR